MNKLARVVEVNLSEYFCFHYQPQINLRTRALRGYESLIRLNHPTLGLISPKDFLHKVNNLKSWERLWPVVMEQLIIDSHKLGSSVKFAINVSPEQLEDSYFLSYIEKMVEKGLLNPKNLEVEITEDVIITDHEIVASTVRSLNKLHINVVIDDFGSGYANLDVLDRLDIQGIKIDRGLIEGIETSEVKQVIVESIVNIAKVKDCYVLAEGVETNSEEKIVMELGCDLAQGFLYGKPEREFIKIV